MKVPKHHQMFHEQQYNAKRFTMLCTNSRNLKYDIVGSYIFKIKCFYTKFRNAGNRSTKFTSIFRGGESTNFILFETCSTAYKKVKNAHRARIEDD